MPTKTTGKGLQRVTSRVWYVTDPDKPRPREHAAKGARPCCAALEKRKRKLGGARKNLFIWIAILSSNDSNGFSSFKIIKAVVLNTVTLLPCSASLSLSLSLSFRSSDKLQQTVPIIHLFSQSNEKHYKWTRVRLLCCINPLSAKVAKLRQDVILDQIDRSSLYGAISHLYSLPLDGRHVVLRF